jgi:hypothetical protein
MPFNFPFQTKPGDVNEPIRLRKVKPEALFPKLLLDKERLKNPACRTPVVISGSCTLSPPSSISPPARLYRAAKPVLFVAHQTMRVK